ncbi:hypothetical protein [Bradyrhizobium valentinum]|uniref:Uncharacterized protein n=1 Tax=Bradyrhizobium valentinum TaxID=1518501 RepID=A0A0R3KUR9_9BRAD|nr:hypothetical protein [Bradyrhizobium valentinum]KRQ99255.1 hypothetical protein CP49_11700 [Bradyrhizobium valentinum]
MTMLVRCGDIKFNPLEDAVMEDIAPSTWNGPHVGKRLAEAMRTLRTLPVGAGGGSGNAWPPYCYEFDDLVAQKEQGELEQTQKIQNRVRVMPSLSDVSRMEIAIFWPAQFLGHRPELMTAVNAVALAHSMERDAGWVTRKRGGYADTWRARHDAGCVVIADGLHFDRVPVF